MKTKGRHSFITSRYEYGIACRVVYLLFNNVAARTRITCDPIACPSERLNAAASSRSHRATTALSRTCHVRRKTNHSLFFSLAQGCHTSSESTDGMLAMLSGIGDGLAEVMAHALDFISLDIEQGLKTYTTIVKVSVAPRGLSHGVSDQ